MVPAIEIGPRWAHYSTSTCIVQLGDRFARVTTKIFAPPQFGYQNIAVPPVVRIEVGVLSVQVVELFNENGEVLITTLKVEEIRQTINFAAIRVG